MLEAHHFEPSTKSEKKAIVQSSSDYAMETRQLAAVSTFAVRSHFGRPALAHLLF